MEHVPNKVIDYDRLPGGQGIGSDTVIRSRYSEGSANRSTSLRIKGFCLYPKHFGTNQIGTLVILLQIEVLNNQSRAWRHRQKM